MKSDYRVRAAKFLKDIFPYICDCLTDRHDVQAAVMRYNAYKHRNVLFNNGIARIAPEAIDAAAVYTLSCKAGEIALSLAALHDSQQFYFFCHICCYLIYPQNNSPHQMSCPPPCLTMRHPAAFRCLMN